METPARMLAKTLDHLRYTLVAISVAGSVYGISKGIISFFSQFALPWWVHSFLILASIGAGSFIAYKIDSGIFHATKTLADTKGRDRGLIIIVFAFLAFANYVSLQIGAATSINELYSTKIKEVTKTRKVKSIIFTKKKFEENIMLLKQLAKETKEEIDAKKNLISLYKKQYKEAELMPERYKSKREKLKRVILQKIERVEKEKSKLLDKKIAIEGKITNLLQKIAKIEEKKTDTEESIIKTYDDEKIRAKRFAFIIFLIFIFLHLLIGFLTRKIELIDNTKTVTVKSAKQINQQVEEVKLENYYDIIYDLCVEASQEAKNNTVIVEGQEYLKQLGRDALIPALNNKLYKLYKEGKIDVQIKLDSKKLSAYQKAYEHMYISGPKNTKLFKYVIPESVKMAS